MATINHGTIYVARQSFVVWDGGRMLRFRRGRTTIRAGHHLIEGRENRFAPLEVTYEVEPASAPSPAASSSSTKKAPPPGAAERAALVARAKALGIPAKGKSAELEVAIEAEERSRAAAAVEPVEPVVTAAIVDGGSGEPQDTGPGDDVTG